MTIICSATAATFCYSPRLRELLDPRYLNLASTLQRTWRKTELKLSGLIHTDTQTLELPFALCTLDRSDKGAVGIFLGPFSWRGDGERTRPVSQTRHKLRANRLMLIQLIAWRYETVQPCSLFHISFQNSLFIVSLPCDFSRLRKANLQHVPRKSMWDGVHWRRRSSTKVAKPEFSVSPVNFWHKRGVPCTWLICL